MKKYYAAALLTIIIMGVSCKKDSGNSGNNPPSQTQLAPDGFNFSTTKKVSINVQLLTNDNKPIKGVLVNVYASLKNKDGNSMFSAISGSDGSIKASIAIPAYMDTLYIDPAYSGLINNAKAVINGSSINGIIGGNKGFSGDIVANNDAERIASAGTGTTGRGNSTIKYDYVAYDDNGRPTQLEQPNVISANLLSFINTSLPEGQPVTKSHPEFLSSNASNNINVTKPADVYVTFVSEAAANLNSLGYYTYPTNKPPVTPNDISLVHVIIPNASLEGSSGGMHTGDKVHLGKFDAGISIGFVLLQNAWDANGKTVNTDAIEFFTTDNLNTVETNTNLMRHAVLLYDDEDKLLLTGFEDRLRSNGSSDNDFNDLVFYTSAQPADAISHDNVSPIDKPTDTDGDGVPDVNDQFPTDPTRAYIQYYPAQNIWGTLAYEDLWPSTGDYDLNDMVVNYRYKYIKNADNNTVEMYGDYYLRAIGATYINGFGVQLPIASNKVSAVTGQKLIAGYIKTNGNGTEAGQTNAVIIPFDDTRSLFKAGGFANVMTGANVVTGDTAHVYVQFISPLSPTDLSADVYNPFIICNQRRGYEVHLPGNKSTDLANTTLFGTQQDNTNAAMNKYYLSAKNWPWALSFAEQFDYPSETNNIATAYLHFISWAQSNGTQYPDWYKDNTGYRNPNFIYHP